MTHLSVTLSTYPASGAPAAHVEQYLISAALRSTSAATVLGHGLSSEMFEVYPDEWSWLCSYMEKHHRVPPRATFSSRYPSFHRVDVDDLDYQASELRKSYANRTLAAAISAVADYVEDGQVDAALREMQKTVVSTARTLGTVADGDVIRDNQDVMLDIIDFHDRIVETGRAGVSTGYKSWDEATGGCKPGELVIVGGRLGGGKSWTLAKIASTALMEGYTVLYDSLEMTRTAITLRVQTLLSQSLGRPYPAADLLVGSSIPDLQGYKEIVAHLEDHVPGALHVADTTKGRISPATISAQVERITPDLVIVDYLTLLEMTGEGDWKSVSNLTKSLQQLAQRYRVPIVVASQLNRADGRTRDVPGADALAQSDSVGQDADQVMNGQRKSKRVMKHRLVKNRHGMDGVTWYTRFEPGLGILDEINKELAQELMDEDGLED